MCDVVLGEFIRRLNDDGSDGSDGKWRESQQEVNSDLYPRMREVWFGPRAKERIWRMRRQTFRSSSGPQGSGVWFVRSRVWNNN